MNIFFLIIFVMIGRRRWENLIVLALLPCLAHAQLRILDRTAEPLPLIVRSGESLELDTLIDDNESRPAVVDLGGTFKARVVFRKASTVHVRDSDPGLGWIFDGNVLPKLAVDFSKCDFARACVVGLGTCHIDVGDLSGPSGVFLVSNPDGSPGSGSTVDVGAFRGRFGVMASGQDGLKVDVGKAELQMQADPGQPAGHVFYANEAYLQTLTGKKFLRLTSPKVRIGSAVSFGAPTGVDDVTAKFKGVWDADYECLSDSNDGGAVDSYGSSGFFRSVWSGVGNSVFGAFRFGDSATFGIPPGKACLAGSFAMSGLGVCYRWETRYAAAAGVKVAAKGIGVVWPAADSTGISLVK